MGRFDRQIQTALRLIKKNGQQVQWKQVTDGAPPDASQPWNPGAANDVSFQPFIAFLPVDKDTFESLTFASGTEVPKASWLGYMGAQLFVPGLKDVVVRDGKELRIAYIDKLAPNGQNILYTILFL